MIRVNRKEKKLLRDGKKVQAIKSYVDRARNRYGEFPLREAKIMTDAAELRMKY